ncbi:MAG TPA: ABC transporter permease [Rhodothermales bacterium]|nr:ABC transporter permease [Rhodothermales bacterium]
MSKRLLALLSVAVQTLRSNPLHILLSTLGLVIGVAALVAILSLGDGLEQYGRNQISTTTSLEAIMVAPKTRDWIDGVSIARDSVATLSINDATTLGNALADSADLVMKRRANVAVGHPDSTNRTGAYLDALAPITVTVMEPEIVVGRFFDDEDIANEEPVVVLSSSLATRLVPDDAMDTLLGLTLTIDTLEAQVIGVMQAGPTPVAYGPYNTWTKRVPKAEPPDLLVRAHRVEEVPALRDRVAGWLDANMEGGSDAFTIVTNRERVAQVQQGVKIFKLIMGFITGIAVLVGGIGVMNVLLIAVTERTREIGIRKATGARRSDIVFQFLAESVVISVTGSLLGLLFGLATVAVAVPIIKQIGEAPFEVAFSWTSLGVIMIVAFVVGIGFGTYPAWRAARLSPVDAIRHE